MAPASATEPHSGRGAGVRGRRRPARRRDPAVDGTRPRQQQAEQRQAGEQTSDGQAPSRTAGVSSVLEADRLDDHAGRPRLADATTEPSGAITPVTPLVAATTSQRPDSMARSRVMANCWSIWSVRMNWRCWSGRPAARRRRAPVAQPVVVGDVEADRVGDLDARRRRAGSSRVPLTMSRGIWLSCAEVGVASSAGTGCTRRTAPGAAWCSGRPAPVSGSHTMPWLSTWSRAGVDDGRRPGSVRRSPRTALADAGVDVARRRTGRPRWSSPARARSRARAPPVASASSDRGVDVVAGHLPVVVEDVVAGPGTSPWTAATTAEPVSSVS